MKRCIIYARIGGPASEVNNSLMQAQLAGLRTTAKGLGLEVVAELPVFEYGTDGNRQSIKTLARDRRHGLYECVLVKNLSRLARGDAILEVGRKFASAGLSHILMQGTPREVFARAEELERVGLDVPQVTKIAGELCRRGLPIDPAVYTIEDLKAELLALKGGHAAC